jgi:hypothetical protein
MMTQARRVDLFDKIKQSLKTDLLGPGNERNFSLFESLIDDSNSIFYNFIEIF